MATIRTDFETINDGDRIVLHPNDDNPIHKDKVTATFINGYFYCDGSKAEDGPDYYWRDVSIYNNGFTEYTQE